MEPDNRVPGITFHLKSAEQRVVHGNHKALVILDADIHDPSMWDDVKEKLQEVRIYQGDNFKDEIIEMLQEDKEQLETEKTTAEQSFGDQLEQLQQKLSLITRDKNIATFEVQKLRAQLAVYEKEITRLRKLEATLQKFAGHVV